MYFEVKAKVGHVGGRKNYKVHTFYVVATSGKEAAYKARYIPRVKHDDKKAIISVANVSYEDFIIGNIEYNKDPFIRVNNIQDQRRYCSDLEIFEEENYLEWRHKKDYEKPYNKKKASKFGYINGKQTYKKHLSIREYDDYDYAA